MEQESCFKFIQRKNYGINSPVHIGIQPLFNLNCSDEVVECQAVLFIRYLNMAPVNHKSFVTISGFLKDYTCWSFINQRKAYPFNAVA